MTIKEELYKLRQEMRILRQTTARSERLNIQLKDKVGILQNQITFLTKENKILKKENRELKDKLDSTTDHKNKLTGMIFKTNVKVKEKSNKNKQKRGGQKNHKGKAKKKSKKIDQRKHCYLTNCPYCNHKVKRSDRTYARIVEDIPEPQPIITTEYIIEKQNCPYCKKAISAVPKNTIPYSPFGTNIITMILSLKYNYRLPLGKIQEYAKQYHQLKLSQGAIQNILHKTQNLFEKEYAIILKKIRNSDCKHADETGWRVEGHNSWCWLFSTQKEALYTIEETRGIGVPDNILTKLPKGVLVRDDYGAYKHLVMPQQSCWAHLLRVSRDGESKESIKLHKKLKKMFLELKEITSLKFNQAVRSKEYAKYTKQLQKIINQKFKEKDTLKIQTRIRNQNTNLITALKYPNVPLSNNHAEQQIRPLTVQRKISGGSRSNQGAKTQAVNMSIIQTLKLRGEDLCFGLKKHLSLKSQKFVVERGE